MSSLEALGKHYFTFTRQQRDGTRFAQVQADRVTRLLDRSWRQIEFAILVGKLLFQIQSTEIRSLCCVASDSGAGGVFIDINSVVLECGKYLVDLLGGVHFGGKSVVHFVVEQIAALLADVNELAYLFVLFLDGECQNILRLSCSNPNGQAYLPL